MSNTSKKIMSMQEALDALAPMILSATQKWLEEQTPEAIQKEVFNRLNSAKDQVAPKLLGFENRYGKWEIDNCNARKDRSHLGAYLNEHTEKGIKDFFESLDLTNIKLFSEREKASLRAEYRVDLLNTFRQKMYRRVEKDAEDLLDQISSTDIVGLIKKTQELIGAEFQPPEDSQGEPE